MGNEGSKRLSETERNQLDQRLHRMGKNVWLTYKSHFESAQYYGRVAKTLDMFTTAIMPLSAAGLLVSVHPSRRAGLAVSAIGLVFSGLEKFGGSLYHPNNIQEKHFKAGIGLSSLFEEIGAFREIRMKDTNLTESQFMEEYRGLIAKKQSYDEIIQTETWAYIKVRENDKHFTKLWKSDKKENQQSTQTK
jgi:hypothetical protein